MDGLAHIRHDTFAQPADEIEPQCGKDAQSADQNQQVAEPATDIGAVIGCKTAIDDELERTRQGKRADDRRDQQCCCGQGELEGVGLGCIEDHAQRLQAAVFAIASPPEYPAPSFLRCTRLVHERPVRREGC